MSIQRLGSQRVAHLARRTQHHRIERWLLRQQLGKTAGMRNPWDARLGRINGGSQRERLVACDRRQMLIPGDLAQPYQRHADRLHLTTPARSQLGRAVPATYYAAVA
jgi:hypothetical protein